MPNPVLRVALATGTLIAALLSSGAGAGVAAADPEDPGNSTQPDPATETPPSSEPEPTTGLPTGPPPSIFDIPLTIVTQLRDAFGRPLSIFGNGRTPGTLTVPGATAGRDATTGRKRDKPSADPTDPKPAPLPEPVPSTPVRRGGSALDVALPFTPVISIPVPSIPVPGYENLRWSLSLTDPLAALTSVGQTLNTVNSLLSDAYASYDPFRPAPPPAPEPIYRILQEEPDVVDASGSGAVTPLTNGSSGLAVLQAPPLVPAVPRMAVEPPGMAAPPAMRVAPPPPGRATSPGEAPAAGPPAGAALPTALGPAPAEPAPSGGSTSALGGPAPRQGYPPYLRSAQTAEVAGVALPGVAGLLGLVLSGGVIGYRQVDSGRHLRSDAARFLP